MRKIPFYFLLFLLNLGCHLNGDAQIVAHFSFDEAFGESEIMETTSTNTYPVENYQNNPERIFGVNGNALRLDGYSTWVAMSNFNIPNISNEMTVEFWYATESFNAEPAGLVHQVEGGQGFSINVNPYGKLVIQFYAEGSSYVITTTQRIEKYKWNHIVFQIDLPNNKALLFVNGELWNEKITDNHNQIDLNNNLTYIGRSKSTVNFDGFPLAVANGAIDELTFYNNIISETTIQNNYNQYASTEVDLDIDHNIRHANDYLRPRYHPMPNTSWTNESYGFTYYADKYHLFFQKNPNAPMLNFMHWGHLSSPDLVNWTEEKIALAPKEGFASKGTWSGTTFFDENNNPVISYTGVNGVFAGIGMAYPLDSTLNDWSLSDDNPVIPTAPANVNHLDFRDPYIWKEGDTYYMVVGSGLQNSGGGILFTYTSSDLINWINVPAIYNNADVSNAGTFWEMPYFNKINDEDYLLVVTSQFNSKPAETIYWMGSFDGNSFTPYQDEPKRFEHLTRHFLSPAIGLDEANRLTYSGIIPEDRDVALQVAAGWRHIFSLPRVLRVLDDGKTLGHLPHPNLCRARQNEVVVENRTITNNSNFNLPEYQGTQSELYFKLYTPGVDEFKIQVFKNEAATQLTSITFDKVQNRLGINRILSSTYQTVENNRSESYDFYPHDTIEVRVFLDHSVMEVFVDNVVVMSARVYPLAGSQLIDIVTESDAAIELLEFRAWDIVDKEVLSSVEVCEITDLPSDLYTTIKEVNREKEKLHVVFPNPFEENIKIEFKNTGGESRGTYYLYDLLGRAVLEGSFEDTDEIKLKDISKGIYFLTLFRNKKTELFRLIKK